MVYYVFKYKIHLKASGRLQTSGAKTDLGSCRMNNEIKKNEKRLMSAEEADRLLACADGLSALLYIHILRRGAYSAADAAADLRCSRDDISRAAGNLRRLGLMRSDEPQLLSDELPDYSSRDIVSRMETDDAFEGVVTEAQRSLGRLLNTNDMRILFGIYDYLGLPAEVIYLLINHCIDTYRARNGDGRMPTMRFIETEARYWARSEIVTLEAAEEHIRLEKLRQDELEKLKDVLQIRGRDLTPTERKYAESWLSMGFSSAALAIAYDRTVVGTGKLTWKYMDKIVQDWYAKRLFTPEAIEQGDTRFSRQSQEKPRADGFSREVEDMRRIYEHLKKR